MLTLEYNLSSFRFGEQLLYIYVHIFIYICSHIIQLYMHKISLLSYAANIYKYIYIYILVAKNTY